MIAVRLLVASKPRVRFNNVLCINRRPHRCSLSSSPAAIGETTTSTTTAMTNTKQQRVTDTSKNKNNNNTSSILASLVAATAGICVVATAAQIVDHTSEVPPFDIHRQRFDQSTFIGRFSRMLLQCDPSLLLYSDQQIRLAQQQLQDFENGKSKVVADDHSLWTAKRLVESAINDQNKIIPQCFRMSGYVPYNGPVSICMITATTTPALLFWSWVNQSQNALVNVFNAAGDGMDQTTLAKSYTGAVSAALLVSYGLATFVQRRYAPDVARRLLRYVAFPSAVVASSLNCYIVRSPEMVTGIPVYDQTGTVVGTSQIAATRGVHATTASRALLQAPVYFLPPLVLSIMPTVVPMVPATTFLLLVSFGIGLPATIALFPQECAIDVKELEPTLQQLIDQKTQQPYRTLYYNKGL